jgi:hypothetical protein
LEQELTGVVEDAGIASRLVGFASMSALTIVAYFYVGLRRLLQTPKPEPEDNIACDIEAVLVSLWGKSLVTDDVRAGELAEDLRTIARETWP